MEKNRFKKLMQKKGAEESIIKDIEGKSLQDVIFESRNPYTLIFIYTESKRPSYELLTVIKCVLAESVLTHAEKRENATFNIFKAYKNQLLNSLELREKWEYKEVGNKADLAAYLCRKRSMNIKQEQAFINALLQIVINCEGNALNAIDYAEMIRSIIFDEKIVF